MSLITITDNFGTNGNEIAGAVALKEEKNRASEIVINVDGIFYVNNKLSVLPYHL